MSYTKDLMHTEWKRPRLYLGSIEDTTQIPNLIEKPLESYRKCLQLGVKRNQLKDVGLHSAIKSIFPIKSASGHIVIDYIDYTIGECAFDVQECRIRGLSYAGVLRALIRVTVYDRDGNGKPSTIKEVKEQDVYLGEIPLMTETGSFIINGTERIVVSQLHRSPGVFLSMTRVRAILLENCFTLRESFLTVAHGLTLSLILKIVSLHELTEEEKCLSPLFLKPWAIAMTKFLICSMKKKLSASIIKAIPIKSIVFPVV